MTESGLSYEQAPPFGLPLAFFLSAPLFLMLAAGAAIPAAPAWTASRWTPEAAALTHLLTLGFLGQVMMGALMQMLPVVIGSPIPWPRLTARLGHLGISLGTLGLAAGLGWGVPTLTRLGLSALAAGWLPFLAATAVSLVRARTSATTTLYPMRQAWVALLLTLVLGVWLAGGLAGLWPLHDLKALTDLHAAWGLLGWVLILVMGVAYQVVPMLQVTPSYPAPVARWLTWIVLAGLMLYSLSVMLAGPASATLQAMAWLAAGGGLAVFAWATLNLQGRRRRKLPDATLAFWRLAMASLLALALLPMLAKSVPKAWGGPLEIAAGLLFLLGFATSVVCGMLYKIVPFLAWFHLQTQTGAKAGTIPNMKEFVPDAASRRHLRLHLGAVILLVPTPFLPPAFCTPGLLLLAAAAHLLWVNLRGAERLFRRYGGRPD